VIDAGAEYGRTMHGVLGKAKIVTSLG